MSFRRVISILSTVIFLTLAGYIVFYPPYYSKSQSLNGEVNVVWKPNEPRSSWLIELREDEKIRVVSYGFTNDLVTIHRGDSIRKRKGSTDIYLKRKSTNYWTLLEKATVRD